jgi:Transposase
MSNCQPIGGRDPLCRSARMLTPIKQDFHRRPGGFVWHGGAAVRSRLEFTRADEQRAIAQALQRALPWQASLRRWVSDGDRTDMAISTHRRTTLEVAGCRCWRHHHVALLGQFKDRLDVQICPSGQAFSVARDGQGLDQLTSDLTALAPASILLEATGGEIVVTASLSGAGLPLAVVLSPPDPRFCPCHWGQLAKTDTLDARIIALFGERSRPQPRPLADADSQILSELVAGRRRVAK